LIGPVVVGPLVVGTVVDEVAFDVERGKIREFARATHSQDPVHTDLAAARRAGFEHELATATHVVVAGHYRDPRALLQRLGLARERVVVGSVRWQYLRPLQAGDAVRGVRRVVDDRFTEGARGGRMRLVTLETEYVDDDGIAVLRQQEVLIERGGPA
jgi:acyl dehydratase